MIRHWDLFRSIFVAVSLLFVSFSVRGTAQAATLYAGSASQTVAEGETFVVDWFLDTENVALNAVQLNLHFSADTLEVLDAAPGNSLLNLWIAPPTFSQEAGTINLTGGVAGGFNHNGAPIFRTTFRAKKTGSARVTMDASSAALINDGRGSQATLTFRALDFVIVPQGIRAMEISSKTHPDNNTWYKNNDVTIELKTTTPQEYSYSFSSNLEISPDDIPEDIPREMVYNDLPDGIYYFKLNSLPAGDPPKGDKLPASSWQEEAVFRVQIDQTPPEKFQPEIWKDLLAFSTVDKTSGISHYKIKVGPFGRIVRANSPFELKRPLIGSRITVSAYDGAGNVRKSEIDYRGYIPAWLFWTLLLTVLALGAALAKLKHK